MKQYPNLKSLFFLAAAMLLAASHPSAQDGSPNQKSEDASKRREWFMRQRSFPSGNFPAFAADSALESAKKMQKPGLKNNLEKWRPLGPQPTISYYSQNWGHTSGRINSIAVSPEASPTILIGAAMGGIWRSDDGGANFSPVGDESNEMAISSVVFSPSDPKIAYAGAGDPGLWYFGYGILKSEDSGKTWKRPGLALQPGYGIIPKIVINAYDPKIAYAGQLAPGGFFLTKDGGKSWQKTFSGAVRDIAAHPGKSGILYLAEEQPASSSGGRAKIYRSRDGGLNWKKILDSPFQETVNIKLAVSISQPDSIYALFAGKRSENSEASLLISGNMGGSWKQKKPEIDSGQMDYNLLLAIHPTNKEILYIGTRDLWLSENGGNSFKNLTGNFSIQDDYTPEISKTHPDQHAFWQDPVNPNKFYLGNDGGLSITIDNGKTFSSLNASLSISIFNSLAISPRNNDRLIGGTQDNGTQAWEKGQGNEWREFAAGDGGQCLFDPAEPGIMFSTANKLTIYRHEPGHKRKMIGGAAAFSGDRAAFYPPFENNGISPTLYFGTYRLYTSDDRGDTWKTPSGEEDLTFGGKDVLTSISVGKANPNLIYTGSAEGRLMVSTNGGASWHERTNGLPRRHIKSIATFPADPTIAYVAFSGYGEGHIFKTSNGGALWEDISSGLPGVPVNHILLDPARSRIYAATDTGIFRSPADGKRWEDFSNGLPAVPVSEIAFSIDGKLKAATHGRGVYEISLLSQQKPFSDFDGDGKSDAALFRPSEGVWHILGSINGAYRADHFGEAGDFPLEGDFDGDRKNDLCLYRKGQWHIFKSASSSYQAISFGLPGDIPVPADYDGDGKSDLGVFRQGAWHFQKSASAATSIINFGLAGDKPVIGDFDGDGKYDLALFRQGSWYVLKSSDGGFTGGPFGLAGDIPAPADFDGDGKTDYALFRPSEGNWYAMLSSGETTIRRFGLEGDIPFSGDFEGDGRADLAVFRPSEGNWYISESSGGNFRGFQFGKKGDIPVGSK